MEQGRPQTIPWLLNKQHRLNCCESDLGAKPSLPYYYQGYLPFCGFVSSGSQSALIASGDTYRLWTQVGCWNLCVYLPEECTGNTLRVRRQARSGWVSRCPRVPLSVPAPLPAALKALAVGLRQTARRGTALHTPGIHFLASQASVLPAPSHCFA